MEPKKRLKKFEEFVVTKNCEPGYVQHIYRHLMQIPLGDRMFIWDVAFEIPIRQLMTNTLGRDGWMVRSRVEWQPIQVRFNQIIQGDEDLFISRFRNWVETERKINISIQRIDPTGVVHDRWDIMGCFPSHLNFNIDLEFYGWGGTEMTLNYDYCNHTNFI